MQNSFSKHHEPLDNLSPSTKSCRYNQAMFQMLTSSQQFSTVFNKPQCKVVDKHFVVLAVKQPKQQTDSFNQVRLGLAVQKKKTRRSVDRSYLKRVIRETLRHHKESLAGWDIVVLTRHSPEIAHALKNRKVIYQSLMGLWGRMVNKV